MTVSDALQLLELTTPINRAGLKKAYRDALMVWHPDRFAGSHSLREKAECRTYQINEAYELLSSLPDTSYPYRESSEHGYRTTPQSRSQSEQRSKATIPPNEHPNVQPTRHDGAAKGWPPFDRIRACLSNHLLPRSNSSVVTISLVILLIGFGAWKMMQHLNLQRANAELSEALKYRSAKRHSEASKLFRSSADRGLPEAELWLGRCYLYGWGLNKDRGEALKWLNKAIEHGNVAATHTLGLLLTSPDEAEADVTKGVALLRVAAESGHLLSQQKLGDLFSEGKAVTKDLSEAGQWYAKAVQTANIAANAGDPQAASWLGDVYSLGKIVPKNSEECENWYRKALQLHEQHAKAGDQTSAWELAQAYSEGKGCEIDFEKAEIWEKQSWDSEGSGMGALYVRAANAYLEGYGVSKNPSLAVKWLQKGTQCEDHYHRGVAQTKLAELYYNGTVIAKNQIEAAALYAEAVASLKRSADQGELIASKMIGDAYRTGKGVPKNLNEAAEWYLRAGDEGESGLRQLEFDKIQTALKKAKDVPPETPAQKAPPIADRLPPPAKVVTAPLAHLETDNRLQSGTVLADDFAQIDGRGKLSLINGLSEDAYVKILEGGVLAASFYVRGGNAYTFDHLPDGTYSVLFCTGFGWDSRKKDFGRGRHARRYNSPINFTTRKTREGNSIVTSTDVVKLTLHSVFDGNARTSDIPLEEFDRY